jgi:signal transduction histidine kinase
MNLLINARDAVLKQMETDADIEGQIAVSTRLTDDTNVVMLSVADNGCGMPAGQLSQIFDPFYTTKPRGQGTGLGLYIVRQILGDHDGEIALKSEPGHGTQVTIFIPVARHSKEDS